jgi:uncharacterized protein (DUF433 family)
MQQELITSDPAILAGKATVRGTRISVELILEKLVAGESIEQLLEAHPSLTLEGVRAALAFAAKSLRVDMLHPLDHRHPSAEPPPS